jgi:ABC-2 type transport system ATP-binding protein
VLKKLLPHGQIELQFQSEKRLNTAEELLSKRYKTNKDETALSLVVTTKGTVVELTQLLTFIEASQIDVTGFIQKTPTLDDAFFEIINKKKGEK